ncbi:E3 SUMO-protein ligase ZBED1-like isoform X1 [Triplophysa rosa]|uniref:E3 SUMO-protein ligase ZBED1-like isoform X1 n=2 Tax=Triplophysa rosa TaxID=992332 RepID=UPI002545C1C1|nr:E3 SUMO-protein ligase ZBED1-like isoform X1 [Triplophysa rosa]
MTTDSGSNMIKALQLNNWKNLGCFGHRLHNAIERSVQNETRISRATGVCKKIVSTFSYSWKKQKALMSAQIERGLPSHKLITESATRWGSRLQMIERVLEQEKAITQVLAADKKTRHLVPTWQDIMALESVTAALKPLQDFTDALSGEAYVSVSYLKPVIHLLNTEILNPKEGDTELTQEIKTKVLDYLNSKYTDPATDELLTMATFLDPRFKTMYLSPEKLEEIKVRAASETEALLEENPALVLVESSLVEDQPEREGETATAPLPSAKKPKKSLGSFFKTSSASASCSQKQIIEQELNSYILAMTPDGETDPLEWWRFHGSHFPHVSCLAKKYLCIPATSSPSERAFSTGGNVVTCSRAALKPEMVNRLVFLAQNL